MLTVLLVKDKEMFKIYVLNSHVPRGLFSNQKKIAQIQVSVSHVPQIKYQMQQLVVLIVPH